MWKNNNGLKGSHPYRSHPFTWPVQEGGVLYWKSVADNTQIYFLGNPIVWWLSTKAIVFYVFAFLIGIIRAQRSIKGGMSIKT
jgi:dolichyl-phosphate-mannose-protein mannosyltransferase